MGWLLLKDLQILRRSPLLLGLLVAYALVIGLPVGFAVSRPPSKPKVAFLNEVNPGSAQISVGGQSLDASQYTRQLFTDIDPVTVKTRAQAIKKVRDGDALAALVVPADAARKLQSVLSLSGSTQLPTLQVLYNADNPLKRRYVENTIDSQLAKANGALSSQLTKVAGQYIDIVTRGGRFALIGQSIDVLGLREATTILDRAARGLAANDPRRAQIERVRSFAKLAADNLGLAAPILSSISNPIRARTTTINGPTSSLDGYAVAVAICVALMFVGVLVAAGMLALEREEHAFGRLVRGLVSRTGLVTEKIALGGIVALTVGVLLLVLLSAFEPVHYGRVLRFVPALALGALGFGALGVVIGALTRDVRAASLLAFLLSLPIAALALVPSGAVGQTAFDIIRVVSALFPFKPALGGLDAALNGAGSSSQLGASLAHLAAIVIVYAGASRLALRRFA